MRLSVSWFLRIYTLPQVAVDKNVTAAAPGFNRLAKGRNRLRGFCSGPEHAHARVLTILALAAQSRCRTAFGPKNRASKTATLTRIHSGRSAVIIIEHSAQSLPTLHRTGPRGLFVARFWINQSILQALMVTLAMIMHHEVLNRRSQ